MSEQETQFTFGQYDNVNRQDLDLSAIERLYQAAHTYARCKQEKEKHTADRIILTQLRLMAPFIDVMLGQDNIIDLYDAQPKADIQQVIASIKINVDLVNDFKQIIGAKQKDFSTALETADNGNLKPLYEFLEHSEDVKIFFKKNIIKIANQYLEQGQKATEEIIKDSTTKLHPQKLKSPNDNLTDAAAQPQKIKVQTKPMRNIEEHCKHINDNENIPYHLEYVEDTQKIIVKDQSNTNKKGEFIVHEHSCEATGKDNCNIDTITAMLAVLGEDGQGPILPIELTAIEKELRDQLLLKMIDYQFLPEPDFFNDSTITFDNYKTLLKNNNKIMKFAVFVERIADATAKAKYQEMLATTEESTYDNRTNFTAT